MHTLRDFARFTLGLAVAAGSFAAMAQDYPSKPLRLVVGFPPGGNVDLVGRLVAAKMTEGLGQSVVVENRTGAGSMIANEYVAKAAPDGYTMLLVSGAYVTQAAVQKKMAFDPIKGFAWISPVVVYPLVIAVRADSRFKTMGELIAFARANPGKLNYPSPGTGTLYHLAVEHMNALARVEMVHVPFRGGGEPVTEVLAGRLDFLMDALTVVWPQLQSGKMRALGVSIPQPSPVMPNVPTIAQTVPGYVSTSFSGLAAPAGTPAPMIDRLNREARRVVELAEFKARFTDSGGLPQASSPEEFGRMVEGEIAKWRKVVEERKIEAQ